jgi:hypothetical protein
MTEGAGRGIELGEMGGSVMYSAGRGLELGEMGSSVITSAAFVRAPPQTARHAEISTGVRRVLNIMTHVMIMLLVLALLFIFYVQDVEFKAMQGLVDKYARESVAESLERTNRQTNGRFRQELARERGTLEKLQAAYAGYDPRRLLYNQTLQSQMFGGVVAVGVGIAAVILTLQMLCGAGGRIWRSYAKILGENIVVFVMALVMEFLFFTLVARKYIPILPSEVTSRFNEKAREALS